MNDSRCDVEYDLLLRGIPLGIQSFCMTITLVVGVIIIRLRKSRVRIMKISEKVFEGATASNLTDSVSKLHHDRLNICMTIALVVGVIIIWLRKSRAGTSLRHLALIFLRSSFSLFMVYQSDKLERRFF